MALPKPIASTPLLPTEMAAQPARPKFSPPPGWQIEPELFEPFKTWKEAPSPENASILVQHLKPIIDSALTAYGGGPGSRTLSSRAKQLAITSLQTYDPKKGTIRTHLLSNLRGLHRAAAAEQNIIQMPEQVALDRQVLQEAEKALTLELGHEPSTAQLADYTGLPIKRITYVRQAVLPAAMGGATAATADSDDEFDLARDAAAIIPGQEDPAFHAWVEFIYPDLSPRDQVILDYSLGLHGRRRLSPSQIAKKLGITPGAVSQRLQRLQETLDARDNLRVF